MRSASFTPLGEGSRPAACTTRGLGGNNQVQQKNKIPQNFNFLFVDNPKHHPQQYNVELKCQAIWRAVVDACSGSRKGKCTFSLEEHLRWGLGSWIMCEYFRCGSPASWNLNSHWNQIQHERSSQIKVYTSQLNYFWIPWNIWSSWLKGVWYIWGATWINIW